MEVGLQHTVQGWLMRGTGFILNNRVGRLKDILRRSDEKVAGYEVYGESVELKYG